MQVPLVDLLAQYHTIKKDVMAAFEDVLEHMQLFLGPRCQEFERDFATYCGSAYGVGVSSGTEALELALRACNIGPGDEVITVANTFIATVEAIALVGATPVFVDVEPDTYTLDYHQLDQALTSHTRAIIPVHLYGHSADMQPILDFAHSHGLRVIEDASQAHGAKYHEKRVGSMGDIGCFSLYYSKNLGAYGEAGICVTSDQELAERLRLFRDHGSRVRYQHEVMGTNGRLDELQAAVLQIKMPYLEQWNQARRALAHMYDEQLRDVVETIPVTRSWAEHVYYTYVVQVPERDQFRQRLQEQGVSTGVHYPVPLHLQEACTPYGYKKGMFPVTEAAAERIVSLPIYPEMNQQQYEYVVQAVKSSLASHAVR